MGRNAVSGLKTERQEPTHPSPSSSNAGTSPNTSRLPYFTGPTVGLYNTVLHGPVWYLPTRLRIF